MRELRDREPSRVHDAPGFQDGSVTSRGFGIRTGPVDSLDRRQEPRWEEPTKRSDESLKREGDTERRERPREQAGSTDVRRERRESVDRRDRRESQDKRDRRESLDRRERRQSLDRREGRRDSDEEKERTRLRDKVTGGLGIAAAAVGLGPLAKDDDKNDKDKDLEPRRRKSPPVEQKTDAERPATETGDRIAEDDNGRERERRKPSDGEQQETYADAETRELERRDAEARLAGEASTSGTGSDEGRSARRRHRPSNSFNPNDASDLSKLKEQLANMNSSDKGKDKDVPAGDRKERTRSSSPSNALAIVEAPRDDERGRDQPASPVKAVRLVSPPRERKEDKPVRGILKQPSARFPEEQNYAREGVAPHKDDKKLKETPPGVKWTKISRKKVNPEALEIGKERFEVREDFVIVLRVLSREEIQAYAHATQLLRGEHHHPLRRGFSPAT